MLAIFKHELRALFHSFTAYVFGAFLLVSWGWARWPTICRRR